MFILSDRPFTDNEIDKKIVMYFEITTYSPLSSTTIRINFLKLDNLYGVMFNMTDSMS